MIKVYVMESCPDCIEVKQRYSNDPGFELVDIGKQARDLKEFLVLRDTHPAFVKVRERGNIGIPCFIKEDGIVIISLKKFDDSFEPVYSIYAARQENPNAYDPWTEVADAELKRMWAEGTSIPDIAAHFGRKHSAIITRIKKLGI